jgi:NADP-dependent 3-hydroxy acid dehydrogenase YdfG
LAAPERAVAVECDVVEWADQQAAVAVAFEHYGRLDAAWANAGLGVQRSFLADTVEHWRDVVLTNVVGAALTIRAALPALKEARGHLLLTGSAGGRVAVRGSLYSATKHAVHAMGESVRQELDGTGVRVTVIAPGMVDTPFIGKVPSTAELPVVLLEAPLHRDDVARAVLFALSQPRHVDVNEILVRPTTQAL